MIDYVRFGHSPLFGDLADIIRSAGGRLKKVVQNLPEQVRPGSKPLAELIAEQERCCALDGTARRIAFEKLEVFEPQEGERYLIGFRSHRLIPLRAELIGTWGLTFPPLIHATAVISPSAQTAKARSSALAPLSAPAASSDVIRS